MVPDGRRYGGRLSITNVWPVRTKKSRATGGGTVPPEPVLFLYLRTGSLFTRRGRVKKTAAKEEESFLNRFPRPRTHITRARLPSYPSSTTKLLLRVPIQIRGFTIRLLIRAIINGHQSRATIETPRTPKSEIVLSEYTAYFHIHTHKPVRFKRRRFTSYEKSTVPLVKRTHTHTRVRRIRNNINDRGNRMVGRNDARNRARSITRAELYKEIVLRHLFFYAR